MIVVSVSVRRRCAASPLTPTADEHRLQRGLAAEGGLDQVHQLDPEVEDVDRLRDDQAEVQRQLQPPAHEDEVGQRPQRCDAAVGVERFGLCHGCGGWDSGSGGILGSGAPVRRSWPGGRVCVPTSVRARAGTPRDSGPEHRTVRPAPHLREPRTRRHPTWQTPNRPAPPTNRPSTTRREALARDAHVSGMDAYDEARAPRPRPTTRATGRAWRASSSAGRRRSPRCSTRATRRSSSGSTTAR